METKKFSSGEVIFEQGEPGRTFFEIKSGTVVIYGAYRTAEQRVLTELGAGSFFGEMAVVEAYPRSAAAVAGNGGAEVVEFESKELSAFLGTEPDRIMEIMRYLGGRIRSLTDEYDQACATVAEMLPQEQGKPRSEGLLAKISYLITAHRAGTKNANAPSVETSRSEHPDFRGQGYACRVEQYPAGTVIFREGEPSSCLYAVHWGKVGIFTGYGTESENKLTEIMPNQFFGEMGMIEGKPRSATAVVLEDETSVELIGKEDLAELFEKNPSKVIMILEHLSRRLRRLTTNYLSVCGVASAIAEAESAGQPIAEETLRQARRLTQSA